MRTQHPLWRAHAQPTTPPASPHEAQHTVCILVSSPCGGVGTSTFAALLALAARQFTSSVALVDRDPRNGGLDVLLGIEEEKGLRWSGLEAPLGTLDYQALAVQLPRWKSVAVLSADPWDAVIENPWEKEAVYAALTRAFSVLIIDAGTEHEARGASASQHSGLRADERGACAREVFPASRLCGLYSSRRQRASERQGRRRMAGFALPGEAQLGGQDFQKYAARNRAAPFSASATDGVRGA